MKQCRITVMRVARYDDLIAQYENPIQHACDMTEGQVFLANGWEKPPASAKVPGTPCPPLFWPSPTGRRISTMGG